MARMLNNRGIPLSMAVWLAQDDYDYVQEENYISATSLIRPLKQTLLAPLVKPSEGLEDIDGRIASRLGTAVHDAIERAWRSEKAVQALIDLGYPKRVAERIRINPTEEEVESGEIIPIYMEMRQIREIDGYKIGGKFDFIGEGRLEDFKTTSTYTYQNNTKEEDYRLQGSIYRWLNPKIITNDHMAIQFLFTDWSKMRAMTEASKGYPQHKTAEMKVHLMSLQATENWIKDRVAKLTQFAGAPEEDMPPCSDKDLWRSADQYKYYKNPEKKSRATKNFDNAIDANTRLLEDGGVGVIDLVKGKVTACKFCPVATVCKQKDAYLKDGSLEL